MEPLDTVYCPVCDSKGYLRVMQWKYTYSCGHKWTCPFCGNEAITPIEKEEEGKE